MRIEEAMVHLERAINTGGSRAQGAQLVIQVQSPGSAGATPCVPVEAVVSGIDWDAGKILLVPEQPLSVAASGVEPPYPTEVEPLIRLSDYEALQAEYRILESELATVKKVAYGNVDLLDECEKLRADNSELREKQPNPDVSALVEALESLLEVQDEDCRYDHQGYCQNHNLDHVDDGCRVARAKTALAAYRKLGGGS